MINTKDCFPHVRPYCKRAPLISRCRKSPALGPSTPALDGRRSRGTASPHGEPEVHGVVCINVLLHCVLV